MSPDGWLDACADTPSQSGVTAPDSSTGMRRGEILGLRWSSVDLGKGLVRVVATLQRVNDHLEFVDPKTDRARRTIALPDFVVEALAKHRMEQTKRRLLLGKAWEDNDVVVDRGDGRPMDPAEMSRLFTKIARAAGATGVRLHDMRHAFATMLLVSGVHPKVVSEALGHTSVGFTMDTYQHVLPSMQAEAARAIETVLGSSLLDPNEDAANCWAD